MLGLLFPLVYNFGTNFFLKDVCFITEALAAVLQLGVTMDFSIFLLHRYKEEKENAASNEEAMVGAICKTTTSIAASSLTTIAGFLALCAMQLTLGRDIGVVMAKLRSPISSPLLRAISVPRMWRLPSAPILHWSAS